MKELNGCWELISGYQEKCNVIILDGPSGCGKSRILRGHIINEHKLILSEEEFRTILLECFYDANLIKVIFLDFDIVCIEDVDFMKGKMVTQVFAAEVINKLTESTRIILTGIDIKARTPALLGGLEVYKYYKFRRFG